MNGLDSKASDNTPAELVEKARKLLQLMEPFIKSGKESLTTEEFAQLAKINTDTAKKIIRKLRREGFIRRTRRGRFKPTLAAIILYQYLARA